MKIKRRLYQAEMTVAVSAIDTFKE